MKEVKDFHLNEAIMDQMALKRHEFDFWDDIDQPDIGVEHILENTEFYDLQANEWIAEISEKLINWWLLQLFDKTTRETQEVVATRQTLVSGDEMWHLKLRENEEVIGHIPDVRKMVMKIDS